jgi:hypothetical protein
VWQRFDGSWIDFTVVVPASLSGAVESGTLLVRAISRLSAPHPVRLSCGAVEHPFTLEPGVNAPQRLTLPPGAAQSGSISFSLAFDAASGLPPVTCRLARQLLFSPVALPSQRVAGMCLRGSEEVPLDPNTGATLHNASPACGGNTKAGGLFMHPPYKGGTGYTFARYTVSVPTNRRFSAARSASRTAATW